MSAESLTCWQRSCQRLPITNCSSRDILAHALLLFTRGIPVIYYGDEQGFTGKGGDAAARQDMFGSKAAGFRRGKESGRRQWSGAGVQRRPSALSRHSGHDLRPTTTSSFAEWNSDGPLCCRAAGHLRRVANRPRQSSRDFGCAEQFPRACHRRRSKAFQHRINGNRSLHPPKRDFALSLCRRESFRSNFPRCRFWCYETCDQSSRVQERLPNFNSL